VRLFLFDIDGTLLIARGAGRAAFRQALERTYGTAGALDVYDLRGKTDPRIVWDVLTAAGVPSEAIEARLGDCFEAYVRELETILGDGHAVELMPGIRELVGALSARPDAVVGLLTGNIEAGARLKLRPTGLLPHFRVGAYGSDHVDRRRLPPIARERAARLVGRDIDGARVTIIGDTPHDVDCARACGAVAVAVATGQYPPDELAACAPDLLFRDFSDVAHALAALTSCAGRRHAAPVSGQPPIPPGSRSPLQ
jgi:phosphoglycolate phosphatase-like HAD superfamily hydrolase